MIRARHVAMWICRELTEASFSEIGEHFNRDHSTTMYAIGRIDGELKTNAHLEERVDRWCDEISIAQETTK